MKTNSSNMLNRILQTMAQCAQIRRLLPLAFFVVMLTSSADAQNVPADQVAQAIDDLSHATLDKIDTEIEINARAFADAKNIQSSLAWGDWFRPFLDIAYGVYEAMTIIPDKNPNSVRTWLKTSIQAADAGKKGFSIFGSFDRLRQDGATLALDIDGPAYNSSVSAMLDRADATSFFFNYALYKNSVQNDLYGTFWQANPLRVSHKSTAFDRSGGGVFNSILEARAYIASQFATLSAQMRQTQLPPAQISSLVSFIQARRQDVLQSRVGPRNVSYQAFLSNGQVTTPRQVSYSLGSVTQLEQWRGQVLNLFVQSAGFDSIGITGRFVEKVGDFVGDVALNDAVETVNLNLNVEAVISGQATANEVLKDATSLGISVAKPDIGQLADAAQSYVSSSREQLNMIPQQMMDCLPGEVSKLLLLVDDTIKYNQVTVLAATATTISDVSPRTLSAQPLPQTQLIAITGTGFTSSSRLTFDDGVNPPYTDRVPTTWSPTQLTYNVAVGPNPATWMVKVVNGASESLPYSFYVVSGTKELTSLSITGPAAISENGNGQFASTAYFSDGSQQTVTSTANWSENSSVTTISSSGFLNAGSVNSDTQVTVSASYTTGGITKTASANVTVVNSASCGIQIQELVSNGNFANNGNGWTLTGNFQADARFSTCYSCPGYAYFANIDGTGGNNLSGTMSKTVTIPANATSATLGYYCRITGTDSTTTAYDFLTLNLVLPGGTLVGIDQRSNLHANTSYAYRSFDVTAYKGQTITIRFTASTDGSGPTVFRVDDVSLIVSVPNPVTPVLFGVGGPTNVTEGGTAQYNAIVVNCDGSIQPVSPTWSENSGATTISSSGLLTVGSVNSDTPVVITATYGGFTLNYPITVVNSPVSFSYLAINGPSTINENSSGQFTATAIMSDGSSQPASPSWSENSVAATISGSGMLSSGEVSADTIVTVSASITIGGITKTAYQSVRIANVPVIPTLASLSITGPDSINENSNGQFTATAWFLDGSSQTVNPIWIVDSAATSVSFLGVFSAGEVASNTPVTLSASFTSGGVTRTAQKNVMVLNSTPAPAFRLTDMNASNGVFRFVVNGPVGAPFLLQGSSNLIDWLTIATNVISSTGARIISDAMPTNRPQWFYRALLITQGPLVLQPGPDDSKDIWTTSVYSYATCANPGPGGGKNDDRLRVGGWGDLYFTQVQFDLAGLPTNAASATLYLYCHNLSGGGTPLYFYRITQAWDWKTSGTGCDHDRLWWADKPTATQWRTNQLTTPTQGQWYAVDVTDLYNAWQNGTYPNYGLQFRPALNSNNNFDEFRSADYMGDMALRPKLIITRGN